jgi:aryl-alcohol dehydrogenase-like predicted oxidoreductase
MRYGRLPAIDKPIARLIQGAVMISSDDLDYSFKLLDDVLSLGGTTFDTAHGYGQGDSERTLGQWLRARGARDQVVIITKGAHHNQDRRRVTPFDITSDLHDSLARLQVEVIDLYLLHRDDPSQAVEPIIDILNEHQAAGRIRAFGASNWAHERVRAANAYAAANGLTGFAVSSPNFSLAEQIKEPWPECVSISGPAGAAARAYYREIGMPLLAWSSLAGGFFSGRFTRDNLDSFTEYLDKLCVDSYCYEDNFRRLDRARRLAERRGLTLPRIALAYVLSQPLDIYALVGCRSKAEFAENIAALDVTLTPQEMAWLDLETDEPPAAR